MKPSWVKLPALYDIIFFFAILIEAVILFIASLKDFSWGNYLFSFAYVELKIYWISIIGIILHSISYLKSSNNSKVTWGNLLGIMAHILFIFDPYYFFIELILIWISIRMLLKYSDQNSSQAN